MSCSRCNGMVVKEHFYDLVDESGTLRLGAWRWSSRCSRCGNLVADRVVETATVLSPLDGASPGRHELDQPAFMMF